MLHRLPNEILLKILEKTKSKTVKECRFLNFQFDNLIQQFQLHLPKINCLSILKYYYTDYSVCLTSSAPEFWHDEYTYNAYEDMLSHLNIQLQKVRSVTEFDFTGISINEDLIRVLTNQGWLRKLDKILMVDCTFDRNAEPCWFSFLSKLRLNVLFIRDPETSIEAATGFTFPKTILNNVRSKFIYLDTGYHRGDAIEIPWMDDSLLENYIDSGKTIWVDLAFTSYTLGGVKEFLKKVSKSNRDISWNAGIMKNVTAEKMENLLKEMKAEYEKYDGPEKKYIHFSILNNARSEFAYGGDYTGNAIEIPWMDDSLLENYIDSGKTIWVDLAFTSYTLGGVKEFLKKVSKSIRNISWESGIMKSVTAKEMDNLLKELKAEYQQFYGRKYIAFSVTKLGAKQEIYTITCRNSPLD